MQFYNAETGQTVDNLTVKKIFVRSGRGCGVPLQDIDLMWSEAQVYSGCIDLVDFVLADTPYRRMHALSDSFKKAA